MVDLVFADFANSGPIVLTTGAQAANAGVAITEHVFTGTLDLGGGGMTANTNLLVADHASNHADTNALETALEDSGNQELTTAAAIAAGDEFLVLYDDGSHSYLAKVTTTAGLAADGDKFGAGDLTAVNLVKFTGITDCDAINEAAFDFV